MPTHSKVSPLLDGSTALPTLRTVTPMTTCLKGRGIQPHQCTEEETGPESLSDLAKEDTCSMNRGLCPQPPGDSEGAWPVVSERRGRQRKMPCTDGDRHGAKKGHRSCEGRQWEQGEEGKTERSGKRGRWSGP